jgi:hypothetical protein
MYSHVMHRAYLIMSMITRKIADKSARRDNGRVKVC